MIFGNWKITPETKISIDGIVIERVKVIKFLGVLVDDKLTWKPHINYVCGKIAQTIGVLAKARHVVDGKSLHLLYCSLVSPYLTYCAEVWGNNYKTAIYPLVCLQKRAIRIIHNVGFRGHTNSLFLQSKVMKFPDLVEYLTVLIIYKANKYQLPGNIQKWFTQREGGYHLK